MSFVERVLWHANFEPSSPALSLPGLRPDVISYGRLGQCIANVCRKLAALDIVPGAVYGIRVKDNLLFIALALAVERLGGATVLITDVERVKRWPLAAILNQGEAVACGCPVVQIDQSWLEGDGVLPALTSRRAITPDDISHIIWTSGSTGTPRGVVHTYRSAMARLNQHGEWLGRTEAVGTRILSGIGFSSGWGYQLMICALVQGGMFCLIQGTLDELTRKIAAYGIRTMVVAPHALAEVCNASRKERRDLKPLRMILTSGGPLRRALAESIRAEICNNLILNFGSTETGAIARAPAEKLDLDAHEVGSVLPGVKVDIVDPVTGRIVNDGTGRIRVSSNTMAPCYFGPEGETHPLAGEDGFLTEDIGAFSAKGVLSVFGRDSNTVNLGGVKTTLETVEQLYAAAPGVSEFAAMLTTDSLGVGRLVGFVVPSEEWSERQFWDHCERAASRALWPAKLVQVRALPRTAMGKIERQKLSSLNSQEQQ